MTGSPRPTSPPTTSAWPSGCCRTRRTGGELQRFPQGIGGKGFFHKDAPDHFPAWIKRVEVPKAGGTVTHALISNADSLVYLVGQNTITPHVWLSRGIACQPDRIVFDLDPARAQTSPRSAARARASSCASSTCALRPGHGVEGHPRLGAAALPRAGRRRQGAWRAAPPRCSRNGIRRSSPPNSARTSGRGASSWTCCATAGRPDGGAAIRGSASGAQGRAGGHAD